MFVLGRMEGRKIGRGVSLFREIIAFYNPTPALPRGEGVDGFPQIRNKPKAHPFGEGVDVSPKIWNNPKVLPLGEDLEGIFSYISNLPQPGS